MNEDVMPTLAAEKPYAVAAALYFTAEPVDPSKPFGPKVASPYGIGQSAGWSVYRFETLQEAEAFASRTTIFGRRYGNRISGPGAEASEFNKRAS